MASLVTVRVISVASIGSILSYSKSNVLVSIARILEVEIRELVVPLGKISSRRLVSLGDASSRYTR